MSSETTVLARDRLFAFSNSYELDGHVSSHPTDVRGHSAAQTYLVKEGPHALLVGTGLTIHEQDIITQVESVLGAARLSLMPLGVDFARICNARPIADHFGLEKIYEPTNRGDGPGLWLDIRPEFQGRAHNGLRAAETEILRVGSPVEIGRTRERQLELVIPPLRLLPTQWAYDATTKAMFTLDVFTWVRCVDEHGPWTLTAIADDKTTKEDVQHHLLRNRYWWLAGADTDRIRRELAETFDRYDIEIIAPDAGAVLKGVPLVQHHYQMLDEVLAGAPKLAAAGVEVGRWTFPR